MATLEMFGSGQTGFDLTSLISTIDKVDYLPNRLSEFFTKESTTSRNFFLDRRQSQINLIPMSANGTAPRELPRDERSMVNLRSVRVTSQATVYADEVANLRAYGTESELEQVMRVYARKREATRRDMEATFESHRLSAIQGKLFDIDGRPVYDYFTEFGVTQEAAIDWDLTSTTFDIRSEAEKLMRSMMRRAKNGSAVMPRIVFLCGDDFFEAAEGNQRLTSTYVNISGDQSEMLRVNRAFGEFTTSGIRFINYRGSDDNEQIAIKSNEAVAFIDGMGALKHAMTPCDEFIEHIGSVGREFYPLQIRDRDRNAWVKYEEYAYPLFFNERPELTQRIKLA